MRALAFIARRLEGQPLGLMLAPRPLDPALTPEAAALVAGPAVELLRLSPLTEAAVAALVSARLAIEPHARFVRACIETTGGNPFLLGELLDEVAARRVDPTAAAAADIAAIVPHGVANAVLLRLARLTPAAAAVARALSVLGECAQVGDAARLAGFRALAALYALMFSDHLDATRAKADEILARARERGAAVTVVATSAFRAVNGLRQGALAAAVADAQVVMELAPELPGAEFLVTAVSTSVLAGLDRDETPDALRGLIDRTGVRFDPEFTPSAQLLYASGVLRAAAGNHQAAIEELRRCALDHAVLGGENPAVSPWRSAVALSLAELGDDEEARALAADELRRAQSFGAPRAIGIALRAHALVGSPAERQKRLAQALEVLAPSPARLEHARVLLDLGACFHAAGQRTKARQPLLDSLALAARCGARALERRAKAELAAIGIRPRTTDHTGADSLTPSELRVAELAAGGGTNREIAQTLFVTEKTVETHLGRAFRKLDISSRRQLPDVLAASAR